MIFSLVKGEVEYTDWTIFGMKFSGFVMMIASIVLAILTIKLISLDNTANFLSDLTNSF